MVYELTESEKKYGEIPGQVRAGASALPSTSELIARSATLGKDRDAYKPMFPARHGAITPATETTPTRFDYLPQNRENIAPRSEMARNPSVRYGLNLGMGTGEQTSKIFKSATKRGRVAYDGEGTGEVSPAQQERDEEMERRGMVPDVYGNWTPPGGWNMALGSTGVVGMGGGAAPSGAAIRGPYRGLTGALHYDDTPIQRGESMESPDMSGISALAAWGARTRIANRAAAAERGSQSALGLERTRQAGETGRATMREGREDARVKLAAELRREPTALELAQAEYAKAQTGETQARAENTRLGMMDKLRMEALYEAANDKNRPPEERKKAAAELERKQKELFEQQVFLKRVAGDPEYGLPAVEGKADGGLIRSFANGGAISAPVTQTQQVNPSIAQYGQYLNAASQSGVPPVSFTQYINLLQSTRSAMQTTPTQFADGGDVSALGRPLEGPGTGRSDSIPAVIDGGRPAALSDGEFVIPAHVVRAKGTEFFEKLLAQYSEGAKDNG